MDAHHLSEAELYEKAALYEIAVFGAGFFGEKTVNFLTKRPHCVVDNNAYRHGEKWLNSVIESPEALKKFRDEHPDGFLVVCVTRHHELNAQLEQFGFRYGENCGITPFANEVKILDDLRHHEGKVLFTNYDDDTGGLYSYDFSSATLLKLKTGTMRGAKIHGGFLYCCYRDGIVKLELDTYEEVCRKEYVGYDFCGLFYDSENDEVLAGATAIDAVLCLNSESLEIKSKFELGNKLAAFSKESYHVNDIIAVKDCILASVFSKSGWWRYGVQDGGILEISRKSGAITAFDIPSLWMPHSLVLHNQRFFILDSMRARLMRDFNTSLLQLNGFLRGLAFSGEHCYIGQSQHRHISRSRPEQLMSVDHGIHLINLKHGATRFVSFPDFSNIYEIIAID